MAQPNMKHLDRYIGCFYEDNIQKQIEATMNILSLLLDFRNIQNILEHESLLQLLSRVLQEEHKKSIDLCVHVQSIFCVLANYQEFHQKLTQFQVGKATMDVIEYQIERFDIRYSQYIELWKQNGGQRSQQTDTELRKLNVLIRKQDKLFFLNINILMNLSEDPNIEKKMRKNGVIKQLIRMLERNDFHLLIITLLFLKKLSIFTECKNQMIQLNLIEKLSRFFTCENETLLDLALGIYKNLAFDDIAKEKIEKNGLIPRIIELLHGTNRFHAIVILYILSINEQIRFSLAYTDLMDLVIKLINNFPEKIIGQELIALAINLASNNRNVEHISPEDLHGLADRAIRNQDSSLLKFCKNVWKNSDNTDITQVGKGLMKEFIKILIAKVKNEDMVLEVLGILSVLKLEKNWKDYLNESVINFLDKQLFNSISEDDVIFETIMVISNICQDYNAAQILSKTNIFQSLLGIFLDRVDDPQFLVQILYAIYMFLFHKLCGEVILGERNVQMALLLLIDDPHQPLRKVNDEVLNQLKEYNDIDLLESIKERKFVEYNKEWLKSTQEYGDNHMDRYDMFDEYVDSNELDPRMWDDEDDYD